MSDHIINVKEFKSTSVDKSLANSITASGSVTAASVTASGTISANALNGGTLNVGNITSSTDIIKSNKILPRDGTDFEVDSTDRLFTSNSNSSIYVSLDSGAANTRDSLRLHHIRGTGGGSYIDYRDDKPLSIRAQNSSNNTSGSFFIKKGYSAGDAGTVIKHSIYNGDALPSSWIGAGNTKQWDTTDFYTNQQWNALPSFNAGNNENYKIICGFYYNGKSEFTNLKRRIIVKFSGATEIGGGSTDTWYSCVGKYLAGDPGILRINNSLNVVRFNGAGGGGGRGNSLLPVSGWVDIPAGNTNTPYFALAISKISTDDNLRVWGYHSQVEIIETVAP